MKKRTTAGAIAGLAGLGLAISAGAAEPSKDTIWALATDDTVLTVTVARGSQSGC